MTQEISQLRTEVARMQKDVGEIKTAICGNDLGTTGIVKRLESVEKKIRRWELRVAWISGGIAASVYGFAGLLKHLFSSKGN